MAVQAQNPKTLNIKDVKQIGKLKEILTKFGIKCHYEKDIRKLFIKGKLIGCGSDYIHLNYNDDIDITVLKFKHKDTITIRIENSITEERLEINLPFPFDIWYVWPYLRIQF